MSRSILASPISICEVFCCQCALGIACGRDGVRGGVERRAKRVAHHLEDVAPVAHDRVIHDLLVPLHGGFHRLGVRIPALGRDLNVGKKKVTAPVGIPAGLLVLRLGIASKIIRQGSADGSSRPRSLSQKALTSATSQEAADIK
jgi:hypothetical protein